MTTAQNATAPIPGSMVTTPPNWTSAGLEQEGAAGHIGAKHRRFFAANIRAFRRLVCRSWQHPDTGTGQQRVETACAMAWSSVRSPTAVEENHHHNQQEAPRRAVALCDSGKSSAGA
jgi:hypothetical protein